MAMTKENKKHKYKNSNKFPIEFNKLQTIKQAKVGILGFSLVLKQKTLPHFY